MLLDPNCDPEKHKALIEEIDRRKYSEESKENEDKVKSPKSHRKWANFLLSCVLPGVVQFLGGKRKRGVLLFVISGFIGFVVSVCLYVPDAQGGFWPFLVIHILLSLGIIIDAFRYKIPRIGIKGSIILSGLILVLSIVPYFIRKHYIVEAFTLPTKTMQPTIMGAGIDENGNEIRGDTILVEKFSSRVKSPLRGDLVVFKREEYPKRYLKRVVGLPGETVSINPPNVLINGNVLDTPRIFKTMGEKKDGYSGYYLAEHAQMGLLIKPTDKIELADDEYFVLGDNSVKSYDSRHFGPIKRKDLLGRAYYIYKPKNRRGRIE